MRYQWFLPSLVLPSPSLEALITLSAFSLVAGVSHEVCFLVLPSFGESQEGLGCGISEEMSTAQMDL